MIEGIFLISEVLGSSDWGLNEPYQGFGFRFHMGISKVGENRISLKGPPNGRHPYTATAGSHSFELPSSAVLSTFKGPSSFKSLR